MVDEAHSDCYRKGIELAEAGRYEEALDCVEEYLRAVPDDVEALNDTGAILHCLGRSDEAIAHLVQAKELRSDCTEIVWNLVEAHLTGGRPQEAAQLFDEMEQMGILNIDVLNRTANLFLNQNNKADALETLLRSLKLAPAQEILEPIIEVIRSKRTKIAFFGVHSQTEELRLELCEFIEKRFPVRYFGDRSSAKSNGSGRLGQQYDAAYELMKWSDISWFESCGDLVAELSNRRQVCRTIIRVYNCDLYEKWLREVRWDNIDVVITAGNSYLREELRRQVPDIESRTQVATIPDGIHLGRFKFIDRRQGKNIACIDGLSFHQNTMFVLQCMQKLHYIDPEYKLFFTGRFESSVLERYIRHMVYTLELTDVVFFEGWQEDLNSWLQDKHYVVCCSVAESRNTGLLGAMACGLKPIIHNFPGVEQIFPQDFVFNISEQFCEQVLSNKYEPQRYRQFVYSNYDLEEQLNKINSVLIQLEGELELQQTVGALDNIR